jgi:hypothetical protein
MTKEQRLKCFEVWAPAESPWSVWTKPVLFAVMEGSPPSEPLAYYDGEWLPQFSQTIAIVLDLPGTESVSAGFVLALRGWRPVPLYNAIPSPLSDSRNDQSALVDVRPIMNALWQATDVLAKLELHADAPPVFLLDAARRGTRRGREGEFDNRSISLPTDFPSANKLKALGIGKITLVQQDATAQPQADLAHTLRGWQENGIELSVISKTCPTIRPLLIERLSIFREFWYRRLATIGLQSNELGGYGGWLPEGGHG